MHHGRDGKPHPRSTVRACVRRNDDRQRRGGGGRRNREGSKSRPGSSTGGDTPAPQVTPSTHTHPPRQRRGGTRGRRAGGVVDPARGGPTPASTRQGMCARAAFLTAVPSHDGLFISIERYKHCCTTSFRSFMASTTYFDLFPRAAFGRPSLALANGQSPYEGNLHEYRIYISMAGLHTSIMEVFTHDVDRQ